MVLKRNKTKKGSEVVGKSGINAHFFIPRTFKLPRLSKTQGRMYSSVQPYRYPKQGKIGEQG